MFFSGVDGSLSFPPNSFYLFIGYQTAVALPVELFYVSRVSTTHYFYSKKWISIISVNWLSITRPLQFPPRTHKQKVFSNIYLNK